MAKDKSKKKKNKKNKEQAVEVEVEETPRSRGARSQMEKHEALVKWIEETTGNDLSKMTPAEVMAQAFAHRTAWRKTDDYRELNDRLTAQRSAAAEARRAAREEKAKAEAKASKKDKGGKGKEKAAESNGDGDTDISSLTVPKLKELAASMNVELPAGRIRKDALIELIQSAGEPKSKKGKGKKSKVTKEDAFA